MRNMKVKETVYVTFCKHSWKVHQTQQRAIKWIEKHPEWSITPAELHFNTPYLEDTEEKDSRNPTNSRYYYP